MIKLCHAKECCLVEAGYWINKDKNIFTRNKILPYKLLGGLIKERKNRGVFITAYRYNTDVINESFLYGDLYFDFDCKDDFEQVRKDALQVLSYLNVVFKIPHNDSKIYFSGNKGVHIIVPSNILGIEPDKNLNGIYRVIAENVRSYTPNKTLDLVIYDNKRLFRIPGSIRESTNLYKIPITYDELRNLSHDEIKTLATAPRVVQYAETKFNAFANARFKEYTKQYYETKDKKVNIKHKGTLKCTPPCIKTILSEGAIDGSRNNTIAVLASFHKNKGDDLNTAYEVINEWNETKNTPPTKKSELERTVRSIYTGRASYGCNTLKQLSVCDESKCPLKKKGGKK